MQLLEFSYHTAQLNQRGCSLSKQIDVCYKIGSVFGVAAHGSNISGKPSKCAFEFRAARGLLAEMYSAWGPSIRRLTSI